MDYGSMTETEKQMLVSEVKFVFFYQTGDEHCIEKHPTILITVCPLLNSGESAARAEA
jgi:hypothetical protein